MATHRNGRPAVRSSRALRRAAAAPRLWFSTGATRRPSIWRVPAPDGVVVASVGSQRAGDRLPVAGSGRRASTGDSERGLVIDKRTFSVYKLLGNELFLDLARPVHLYLLHVATKSVEPLIGSFDVEAATWSPDGEYLP